MVPKTRFTKKLLSSKRFLEFYGVLVGDGCISRYKSGNNYVHEFRIDGNSKTDYAYYELFLVPLINGLFDKNLKIYRRRDCNGIFLRFKNKKLALFMNEELVFPFGKKGEIKIFSDLSDKQILPVLRGFFDTDGSIYFTKNNSKIRNYPIIELSTHSKSLLIQMKQRLVRLGFNPIVSHFKDSIKLHGKKSLLMWFRFLGSNNPDKFSKFHFWKKKGYCPKSIEMDLKTRLKLLGP